MGRSVARLGALHDWPSDRLRSLPSDRLRSLQHPRFRAPRRTPRSVPRRRWHPLRHPRCGSLPPSLGWAPLLTLRRRSPPPPCRLCGSLLPSLGGAGPLLDAASSLAAPLPRLRFCGSLLPSLGAAGPPLDAALSLAPPPLVFCAAPCCRRLEWQSPPSTLWRRSPTLTSPPASLVRLPDASFWWHLPRWARCRPWPPRRRLLSLLCLHPAL